MTINLISYFTILCSYVLLLKMNIYFPASLISEVMTQRLGPAVLDDVWIVLENWLPKGESHFIRLAAIQLLRAALQCYLDNLKFNLEVCFYTLSFFLFLSRNRHFLNILHPFVVKLDPINAAAYWFTTSDF